MYSSDDFYDYITEVNYYSSIKLLRIIRFGLMHFFRYFSIVLSLTCIFLYPFLQSLFPKNPNSTSAGPHVCITSVINPLCSTNNLCFFNSCFLLPKSGRTDSFFYVYPIPQQNPGSPFPWMYCFNTLFIVGFLLCAISPLATGILFIYPKARYGDSTNVFDLSPSLISSYTIKIRYISFHPKIFS